MNNRMEYLLECHAILFNFMQIKIKEKPILPNLYCRILFHQLAPNLFKKEETERLMQEGTEYFEKNFFQALRDKKFYFSDYKVISLFLEIKLLEMEEFNNKKSLIIKLLKMGTLREMDLLDALKNIQNACNVNIKRISEYKLSLKGGGMCGNRLERFTECILEQRCVLKNARSVALFEEYSLDKKRGEVALFHNISDKLGCLKDERLKAVTNFCFVVQVAEKVTFKLTNDVTFIFFIFLCFEENIYEEYVESFLFNSLVRVYKHFHTPYTHNAIYEFSRGEREKRSCVTRANAFVEAFCLDCIESVVVGPDYKSFSLASEIVKNSKKEGEKLILVKDDVVNWDFFEKIIQNIDGSPMDESGFPDKIEFKEGTFEFTMRVVVVGICNVLADFFTAELGGKLVNLEMLDDFGASIFFDFMNKLSVDIETPPNFTRLLLDSSNDPIIERLNKILINLTYAVGTFVVEEDGCVSSIGVIQFDEYLSTQVFNRLSEATVDFWCLSIFKLLYYFKNVHTVIELSERLDLRHRKNYMINSNAPKIAKKKIKYKSIKQTQAITYGELLNMCNNTNMIEGSLIDIAARNKEYFGIQKILSIGCDKEEIFVAFKFDEEAVDYYVMSNLMKCINEDFFGGEMCEDKDYIIMLCDVVGTENYGKVLDDNMNVDRDLGIMEGNECLAEDNDNQIINPPFTLRNRHAYSKKDHNVSVLIKQQLLQRIQSLSRNSQVTKEKIVNERSLTFPAYLNALQCFFSDDIKVVKSSLSTLVTLLFDKNETPVDEDSPFIKRTLVSLCCEIMVDCNVQENIADNMCDELLKIFSIKTIQRKGKVEFQNKDFSFEGAGNISSKLRKKIGFFITKDGEMVVNKKETRSDDSDTSILPYLLEYKNVDESVKKILHDINISIDDKHSKKILTNEHYYMIKKILQQLWDGMLVIVDNDLTQFNKINVSTSNLQILKEKIGNEYEHELIQLEKVYKRNSCRNVNDVKFTKLKNVSYLNVECDETCITVILESILLGDSSKNFCVNKRMINYMKKVELENIFSAKHILININQKSKKRAYGANENFASRNENSSTIIFERIIPINLTKEEISRLNYYGRGDERCVLWDMIKGTEKSVLIEKIGNMFAKYIVTYDRTFARASFNFRIFLYLMIMHDENLNIYEKRGLICSVFSESEKIKLSKNKILAQNKNNEIISNKLNEFIEMIEKNMEIQSCKLILTTRRYVLSNGTDCVNLNSLSKKYNEKIVGDLHNICRNKKIVVGKNEKPTLSTRMLNATKKEQTMIASLFFCSNLIKNCIKEETLKNSIVGINGNKKNDEQILITPSINNIRKQIETVEKFLETSIKRGRIINLPTFINTNNVGSGLVAERVDTLSTSFPYFDKKFNIKRNFAKQYIPPSITNEKQLEFYLYKRNDNCKTYITSILSEKTEIVVHNSLDRGIKHSWFYVLKYSSCKIGNQASYRSDNIKQTKKILAPRAVFFSKTLYIAINFKKNISKK